MKNAIAILLIAAPALAAPKTKPRIVAAPTGTVSSDHMAKIGQPISPAALKDIYTESLEIKVSEANINEARAALEKQNATLHAKYDRLFQVAGIKESDWNVDLKSGTMTKKVEEKK